MTCFLVGMAPTCPGSPFRGDLASCNIEARENTESRRLITRKAGKVITWTAGRCYPGKPKAREKIKANGFPLGHDCNPDSTADKMPPLCSASCVFIRTTAVGHFIQVPLTWSFLGANEWQGAPQLPRGAVCKQTSAKPFPCPCLSSACCLSLWALPGTLAGRPALCDGGWGLCMRSPQSSIGLFMWEVTAASCHNITSCWVQC